MARTRVSTLIIVVLLTVMFLAGLFFFYGSVLDQRFHFFSQRMREIAVEYQFQMIGLGLLAITGFLAFLCGTWWLGRRLKVPRVVIVLVWLALIVAAYFWIAGQLRGTIRG